MTPGLTDRLCTRCGLCCDGSWFADVELADRAEAARLEALGLELDDDDADASPLPQPCRALRGTRCSIYAHRPASCRAFECRLLRAVRRGTVAPERAAARIARTRRHLRRVERQVARLHRGGGILPLRERCAEVLGRGGAARPGTRRSRAALEAAMSALEDSLRACFLGGRRS